MGGPACQKKNGTQIVKSARFWLIFVPLRAIFSNIMNFNSETGFRLLSLRYVLERERKNSRKMKELRNADRISSGDCVSVWTDEWLLSKISLVFSATSYDRVSLLYMYLFVSLPLSLTLNKCLTLCVCGACVLPHDRERKFCSLLIVIHEIANLRQTYTGTARTHGARVWSSLCLPIVYLSILGDRV